MMMVFQKNWHRGITSSKRKHVACVVMNGKVLTVLFTQTYCCYVDLCVYREREQPPRFARPGTFEFEYSKRWKSLDEMEKQQREQVEKNMREAREKLDSEMEDAYHEHQANMLRQGKF